MHHIEINTQSEFEAFCKNSLKADLIAIDTEFMRDRYYYPQLCLLQLACQQEIALIDPFKINSYEPLKKIFKAKSLLKIFHSAQQDLEVLELQTGEFPSPIYDTQIAATFLGSKNQISYADIVYQILNVKLDKSHTRTDWSKRPLSSQQLSYAANDVKYLEQIYRHQYKSLTDLGRLDWLNNELETFTKSASIQNAPQDLWKKIKGAQSLKGRQLNILKELAIFREKIAQQKNLPRRFILKDDILIDIVRLKPETISELSKLRQFPKSFSSEDKQSLINAIQQALAQAKEEWPKHRDFVRLNKAQEAITDCIMAIIKQSAANNDFSPELIATRKEIDAYIAGNKQVRLLQGWRYEIAGKQVDAFVQGKLKITIKNHQLDFTES